MTEIKILIAISILLIGSVTSAQKTSEWQQLLNQSFEYQHVTINNLTCVN